MLAVDKTNVVLRKLEGSYADLLDELSRKSFGGLSITDVREDRGTDERKVILEFKIGKTTHTLKMRAMKDGGIDPAIISEVNKLMVGKRRFVVATLDEPRILIVAIDKKFENILRMDGIKFITAGELKKLV